MNHTNATTTHGPIDGPADYPAYSKRDQTGLLTRFVPSRLKGSPIYRALLRLTRALQFLSSVISLGIFSQRLYKVYRLVNTLKARRGVNGAYGAVEGILAAAVLYTLINMLFGCIKKSSNPGGRKLRWTWVVLDLAFVGAFIAAAVLTRPDGGDASPRHCYNNPRTVFGGDKDQSADPRDDSCNLPWGTFILSIVSTLLHAITASFHEIKEHRHRNRVDQEKALQQPTTAHHSNISAA